VVIVDPDEIVLQRTEYFYKFRAKRHVGADVGGPEARIEATSRVGVERDEVMHHRPQLLFAEFCKKKEE
jgi:hypothetical protein